MILHGQISNMNDPRQKADCMERYRRGDEDESTMKISFIDVKETKSAGFG
jgi:hypothetical protein